MSAYSYVPSYKDGENLLMGFLVLIHSVTVHEKNNDVLVITFKSGNIENLPVNSEEMALQMSSAATVAIERIKEKYNEV